MFKFLLMRGLFNKVLGASLCAPFVPKSNPLAAAAIAGGASLLGGMMSAGASANLNAANREYDWNKTHELMDYSSKEASYARLHQEHLQKQQQQWNEYYYNMYNSPSAMRKQLEEAGYHPYLGADSQPNVGSVPSASAPSGASASAPNTGNPFTVAPDFSFVGQGTASAVDAYLRAKSVNADVANQQQKTIQDALKNTFEYYKLTGDKDGANALLRMAVASSSGVNADAPEFRILQASIDRQEIAKDYEKLHYDIEKEFGRTERADKIMNMEQDFSVKAAEIGRMAVQNKLDDAYVDRVASEIARNFSAANLDNKNAKLINDSLSYLVNKARNDAVTAYYGALTSQGEYGIKAGVYSAAASEVGQFVEQTDYYLNKIVDKVGKVGKFNISTGTYNTNSNVNGVYSTTSNNKNWNIRSTWDPKNGYNIPTKGVGGNIDDYVR